MSTDQRDDQADACTLRAAAEVLAARATKETFLLGLFITTLRKRADRIARPA